MYDDQERRLEENPNNRNRSNSGVILTRDQYIDFDVKIGNRIGEGAYGQVYKCLNLDYGGFVAVKHIDLKGTTLGPEIDIASLCKEIGRIDKVILGTLYHSFYELGFVSFFFFAFANFSLITEVN